MNLKGRCKLINGQKVTIGILTTPQKDIFHSNYHIGLLSGIMPRIKSLGCRLRIVMMPARPYGKLADILTRHKVDGMMILTWRWIHPALAKLVEEGEDSRILVVNDPLPRLGVNCLYTDTDRGVKLAVKRLVKKGVRKIGMIHGPIDVKFRIGGKNRTLPFIDSRLKKAAFIKALQAEKIPLKRSWIRSTSANSKKEGYRLAVKWFFEKQIPRAIVCGNDDLAFGVLEAMKVSGFRCPEDVAVIGFDDNPKAAGCKPPLTTIRQPLRLMGKEAVDILYREITRPRRKAVLRKYTPVLVVRRSS
ncbi:MAG: HTH-type transcriptional repressor PurR [Candidatus Omnitrophica bacterium ADurb.Bin277]|nr:MAG: HTH-type transcriptional repressor PurR [Candidatus Omnitrophica bacterium ADurb.Bin277]